VDVVCRGPFRARTLLWQPGPGAWALTVACHVVHDLLPHESPVTARPLAAVEGDGDERRWVEPWGPVAPRKRWPEVVVVGRAPAGETARLSVGELDKVAVDAAALGPLGPASPLRAARHGHLAASWVPSRWAEWPLPHAFDLGYFDVAPTDQALQEITGAERIALEHLHPSAPRLVTYLAGAPPRAVLSMGGVEQPVAFACDTLVIDAERGQAILVWRAVVALDHPRRDGVVVIGDLVGQSVTGTLGASASPARAALPFQPLAALAGQAAPSARPSPGPPRRATTLVMQVAPPPAPLPFAAGAPPSEADDEPPPTVLLGSAGAPGPALPFALAARPARDPDEEPITERRPPGYESAPPPPIPPALVAIAPPLLEPLPPSPPPPAAPAPLPEAPPAAEEPPPPPPPPPALTLERCAVVAARLAHRPHDRAAILEVVGLDEDAWAEQHGRRLAEIDEDLSRGKRALLSTYDQSYVGALEDARGPVTALEYARISVAAERGRGPAKLAELELPSEAMMRIRRVWLERSVKDPRVGVEVRAALRAAREE
jgi:hypothetical protein